MKFKKLLLIGSTINPVHLENYYDLIKDQFEEILIIGTHSVDFSNSQTLDFQVKNPIKLTQSILKLRKIIKTFKPTFVHVHQANSFGFITSLANKKRFPQILTTWGDDVLIFPKKNFFYRLLTSVSIKYADVITADAAIMQKAIFDFTGRKDTVLANFGIDFNSSNSPKKENLIYSNRLHHSLYNIDKIIEGTIPFLEKNPDWSLIVAANGSLTEYLVEKAEKSLVKNQIQFVGFLTRKENIDFYQRSKIYVSIPNTDGTSISLLEALAYGCLPIVSNLPANCEWVNSGENGIVMNSISLEECIKQILELDYELVINKNQEIINQRATKEVNKSKFISIYNSLLK